MKLFVLFVFLGCFFAFDYETEVTAIVESKEQAVKDICDAVTLYYSGTEVNTDCTPIESCTKPDDFDEYVGMGCVEDETCGGCGTGDKTSWMSFDYPSIRYHSEEARNVKEVKEFICFTSSLTKIFSDNYDRELERPGGSMAWQYIGSPTGAFNMWPAKSDYYDNTQVDPCKRYTGQCSNYDPRIRPWYIAAASGPKDVVLILDVSGSMTKRTNSGKQRMTLLREAAETVINGLGIYDRLYIVFFNVKAHTCDDYFGGSNDLQYATSDNKDLFYECVGDIDPISETNFEVGFDEAFRVLGKRSASSITCHTAILFLTDGVNNRGATGKNLLKKIETMNTDDVDARIFTFSLSNDADDVMPQKIACGHRGVWIPIKEKDDEVLDLRKIMTSYFLYFSFSDVKRARGQTWTEAYWDFSGLGWMTTVAMGCFSEDGQTLVGVAGVDVVLEEFNNTGADFFGDVDPWLRERSNKCYDNKNLDEKLLESLRAHHKCSGGGLTGDNAGVYIGIAAGIGGGAVFVIVILVIIVVAVGCFLKGSYSDSKKETRARKVEPEVKKETEMKQQVVQQQPPPQNEMYPGIQQQNPMIPGGGMMNPMMGDPMMQQPVLQQPQFVPPDPNMAPPVMAPPGFQNTPPTVPEFEV